MIEVYVNINKISDISEFVNCCVKTPCDVILKSDRYSVNGKSIMGIYSLDLTKNIKVEISGNSQEEENRVFQDLRKFSVIN